MEQFNLLKIMVDQFNELESNKESCENICNACIDYLKPKKEKIF